VEWGGALADASAGVDTLVVTSSLIRGSYRNGVPGTTLEVIPLAGVPINAYHVHYPQQQTHSPLVANIISHAEFKMYDGLGRALTNRGIDPLGHRHRVVRAPRGRSAAAPLS
jgi:hypothetical protein